MGVTGVCSRQVCVCVCVCVLRNVCVCVCEVNIAGGWGGNESES